jgi:hypothetical protein
MTELDENEKPIAPEPDVDDDDVEGHRSMAQQADGGPDSLVRRRVARPPIDDDEDVEGHFGHLKSPSSRGE